MDLKSPAIKLVVGLGNPGEKYARTRHNLGYQVVKEMRLSSYTGAHLFISQDVFMNESGKPVADLVRYRRLNPQEVLVVCDDFSIPLGTPRIRLGGSSGGHNGLDSIIQELGTPEIPRLRGGIGPVPPGQDPAKFVLEPFAGRDEVIKVEKFFIPLLIKIVDDIVIKGLEFAMNQYNNKGL